MKHKPNIPNRINVGFQNRKDTYTGKLAYVVYTDSKGVLRKERSWDRWRDNKIEPEEFENVPTDGFVLNKKTGDHSYGWNPRKAWVRVYDPRGFEFEISINNLVFILEECSSIKGKGLEGEFVYAWDRAKLLLLPVSSQEYKYSVAFAKAVENKVTKADMKEGYCYLNKEGEELIYLGRLPYWSFHRKGETLEFKSQKKHIFARLSKNKEFYVQSGFTKILSKLSDEPSPLFPERFEEYKKSKYGSGPAKLAATAISGGYRYWNVDFVKDNDEFYRVQDCRNYYSNLYSRKIHSERSEKPVKIIPGKSVIVPLETSVTDRVSRNNHRVSLCVVNESGKRINVGDHYG